MDSLGVFLVVPYSFFVFIYLYFFFYERMDIWARPVYRTRVVQVTESILFGIPFWLHSFTLESPAYSYVNLRSDSLRTYSKVLAENRNVVWARNVDRKREKK